MATVELSADGLAGFDLDSQGMRYPYNGRFTWPVPLDPNPSRAAVPQRMANVRRSTSPIQSHAQEYEQPVDRHPQALIPEWQMPPTSGPQLAYSLNTTFPQQFTNDFQIPYHTSPAEFVPPQSNLNASVHMENPYYSLSTQMDAMPWSFQDIPNDLMTFGVNPEPPPEMNLLQQHLPQSSPTDTYPDTYSEFRSRTSSDSGNGWNPSELLPPSLGSSSQHPRTNICNPGQIHYETTFSDRTFSESSYSDIELPSQLSGSSYVEVSNLEPTSSPGTDSVSDMDFQHILPPSAGHVHDHEDDGDLSSSPVIVSATSVPPIDIKTPAPLHRSLTSTGRGSPPGRRQQRKNASPKATKSAIRKPSQAPKVESEKKVGRRKGPLQPEARKQACEIRKLGACLRCRFLKKTVSAHVRRGSFNR